MAFVMAKLHVIGRSGPGAAGHGASAVDDLRDGEFPAFILDDNGKGAGPFPEVVRAVCDSMKIQCTLKVLPWRRAYAMAVTGVVDGIFVLARNPEREQSRPSRTNMV